MSELQAETRFEIVWGGSGYFKNGTVLQIVSTGNGKSKIAKVLKNGNLSKTVRGELEDSTIKTGIENGALKIVQRS